MKLGPNSGDSSGDTGGVLIPGLPNEVAELCLLRLPFPYFFLARTVSSTWNQTLSKRSLLRSKSDLYHPLPNLFVLASDRRSGDRLQWQALDPRSRRWFLLPPMPDAYGAEICGASLACAADREKGEIYVMGGKRVDGSEEAKNSTVVYSVANNSWRVGSGMRRRRAYFTAASIGGMVYVVGGRDARTADVERYDPATDRWDEGAAVTSGWPRYDTAVIDGKMLVTVKWKWPFPDGQRVGIYDTGRDAWEEMSVGLQDGWKGVSAVVRQTLFVVSEYVYGNVKAYDPVTDSWASATRVPVEEVREPYAVAGDDEGRIYVVGKRMDVAIGIVGEEKGWWRIKWEVVKGPKAFVDLVPCSSQVLYA